MTLEITPLHPDFGALVRGFDFSAPPEQMQMEEVRAAIARHGVLVFRNATPPTDEEHIAFSRMLGPIELGQIIKVTGFNRRRVRSTLPRMHRMWWAGRSSWVADCSPS